MRPNRWIDRDEFEYNMFFDFQDLKKIPKLWPQQKEKHAKKKQESFSELMNAQRQLY